MLNILKNGLQAMPEGGDLRVAARRSHALAVVTIADTGPGIQPEERERIFEPFHTTRPRGTGLGLAVCRKIVAEHGGTITADSDSGGGALFIVTLPAGQKG